MGKSIWCRCSKRVPPTMPPAGRVILFAAWLLLGCGTALCTLASESALEPLRWHGFLNQGFIKTDHNNFFGNSEDVSWKFTDIGLGVAWRPLNWLQLSAQAIYRQAGETSPDDVHTDFAVVDLNLVNTTEFGADLRLGRVKNAYGLYNETRDIAAARPSILLPESIYLDTLRELFHSADSVAISFYRDWGHLLLHLDASYGRPVIDDFSQAVILTRRFAGDFKDERLWVGRVMLEHDGGRLRYGFSASGMCSDFEPAPTDPIIAGQTQADLRLLSLEYNLANWQFAAEYQRRDLRFRDIFGPGYRNTLEAESYYLQANYQVTDDWRLLARYDVYYPDRHDKSGRALAQQTGVPHYEGFAKDVTLGARYDVDEHWTLSLEYHHIKGTAWIARKENPDPTELKENWNMLTAQIGYRF